MSQMFLEDVCLALCARRDSRVSAIWEPSPEKRENKILAMSRCALHAVLAGPQDPPQGGPHHLGYAGAVLTSAGSHCQASSHVREACWISGLGSAESTRRRLKAILGGAKWQTLVLGAAECCRVPPWGQASRLHTPQLFSCLWYHTRFSSKVDSWPAPLTPMVRSGCRKEDFPIRLQAGRDCPPVCHTLDLSASPGIILPFWGVSSEGELKPLAHRTNIEHLGWPEVLGGLGPGPTRSMVLVLVWSRSLMWLSWP